MTEKHITVDYLARVEGEGALRVKVVDDQVADIQLNIFEPPRFFEAFFGADLASSSAFLFFGNFSNTKSYAVLKSDFSSFSLKTLKRSSATQ